MHTAQTQTEIHHSNSFICKLVAPHTRLRWVMATNRTPNISLSATLSAPFAELCTGIFTTNRWWAQLAPAHPMACAEIPSSVFAEGANWHFTCCGLFEMNRNAAAVEAKCAFPGWHCLFHTGHKWSCTRWGAKITLICLSVGKWCRHTDRWLAHFLCEILSKSLCKNVVNGRENI